MAKDTYIYEYQSHFGSHSDMVDQVETDKLHDPKYVVCRDERGLYVTERDNLDRNLADSYRNALPEWRTKFLEKLAGEVIEIIV